jgi:hypothetical protein
MQHTAPVRTARLSPSRSRLGFGTPLLLLCALFVASLTSGCSSHEVDSVREYKVFLDKAKPSLTAMNKARQDLYDLSDPDKMAGLFKDQLLKQVDELKKVADEQPKPEGKLGDIHASLQATLLRYDESTRQLVDHLKSPNEDVREKAILAWGVDDQKFGKEMTGLVNDLSKYLEDLKQ